MYVFVFAIIVFSMGLSLACAHTCTRMGLVDHPDVRKRHRGSVPLAGGPSIVLAIAAGALVADITLFTTQAMLIALALFLVGLFDDCRHINPWLRLGVQYVAGVLLATWGGVVISNVGNLLGLGNIPLMLLAVPLTALSVAGLCNAYNMIDGIDGLASSLIALPLLALYCLALRAGHPMAPALLLMLLPIAVFLAFNLGPNTPWWPKIFLGDSGSTTLGFLVTASLVYFSQGRDALIQPVTALWLVTVPLMDMLATMGRRVKQGHPLMEADHNHLHHALMHRGLSARQALVIMLAYAALAALAGVALEQVPAYVSMALYFLLFFGHCVVVIKLDHTAEGVNLPRLMEHYH